MNEPTAAEIEAACEAWDMLTDPEKDGRRTLTRHVMAALAKCPGVVVQVDDENHVAVCTTQTKGAAAVGMFVQEMGRFYKITVLGAEYRQQDSNVWVVWRMDRWRKNDIKC